MPRRYLRWVEGSNGGCVHAAFLDDKRAKLDTIVDKVFSFDIAPHAFEYPASCKHVEKVMIKVPETIERTVIRGDDSVSSRRGRASENGAPPVVCN
jgi:hypothetical protein